MIRLTLLDKCDKDVKSSTNANAIYWMNGMNEWNEWMEWMKMVIYLVELMLIWLIVKCDFAKIVSNGTYHYSTK